MRYPRRKPSVVLAAVAMTLGAALFVDLGSDRSTPSVRPVDTHRSTGPGDAGAIDSTSSDPTGADPTGIDTVDLREVPNAVVGLARSGLARAGIRLPEIDLSALPLPTATAPATSPTAPSTAPTAPSTSATAPSTSATAPSTSPTAPGRRPVGALVKHLVRDTPFKMVGFTWNKPVWDDAEDATMMLRAKDPVRGWGDWVELEPIQTSADPSAEHPGGTEPVWVGAAKEIQLALTDGQSAIPAADSTGAGLADLVVGSAGEVLKNLASTVLPELTATLLSPDSLLSLGSSMLTTLSGGPQVISRAAWGADENIRCSQPAISPTLNGAIVHHTAGSNDYTPQQSAEIVRGIYAYHARTLNWCDIGYNVLVDKYGQIFEGAFGGLDRNVEGTHTGGFNKNTVGVSMIGNLDEVAPSGQMLAAVGRFLKWRLNRAGLNPAATATLTSEYFSDSKFPPGTQTHLPVIAGHRDYNNTSCPGIQGYPALDQIRALAGAAAPPAPESPAPDAPAPEAPAPAPAQ
ncbi:N-acetylmuramoyl-L-alanine amidase [Gordonia polyisoprenivorans]|uniref:N-acetylmuramoyl-L-alanine amidase n=1 Tax=Gordonia polyisoprenivorans TaxID=84595 RepID=UPI001FCC445F|nr:N-acetylmuramoyl-L-alanine amidase [Gordonia polyisoprenivorans]